MNDSELEKSFENVRLSVNKLDDGIRALMEIIRDVKKSSDKRFAMTEARLTEIENKLEGMINE